VFSCVVIHRVGNIEDDSVLVSFGGTIMVTINA